MPLTLHTPETIFSPRHVPSWLMLAAAAGFIDGFAFITCQQAVTYMTGIATRMGLEYPDIGLVADYVIIFLCFLAGAISAFVGIQWRAQSRGQQRWATPLFVVAGVTASVALMGYLGVFGEYGGRITDPPPVAMLAMLAFAAGLQNASVSATTGMSIRTTHLTGPTTDMGLLIGAAFMTTGEARRAATRGALLRGGIVIAFVLGAGLSLPLTNTWGYLSLLVSAGLVAAAGVLSFLPDWAPSDLPFFNPDKPTPKPEELIVGLPADGKPTQ